MSGSYTQTPNLGLYKPTPNSDTGTWGYHLNSNADLLDNLLGTSGGSGSLFLPIAGGQMTGPILLAADPVTGPAGAMQAVTRQYVDNNTLSQPGGDARYLQLTGGTVSGTLASSNTLNAAAFNATGTATFGPAGNKQVQLLGGAGQAFVNSIGGPLTLQSASGNNINLNPLGTGTNVTINGAFNQALFGNGIPPVVGNNITGSGFTMGTDSAVVTPTQGVNWVGIGGNVGAIPWAPNTAVTLNAQRNNGGRIYIVTTAGTTAASGGPTGTGTGIADGTAVWNYVSSDFVGIRQALSVSYGVRSTTGPTATTQQKQWPVFLSTFTGSANQGGTGDVTGSAIGIGYAAGLQSWLMSGATHWQSIGGMEVDVGIFTGASARTRYGLNFVSFGNLAGNEQDCALWFGSTLAGGSSGIPFRDTFLIGEGALQASGSNSVLSYKPRPAGALAGATYTNPGSALGIDLANILFSTAAFRAPGGAGIDGNGYVFSGAARLSTSASAVALDAVGSLVTAVASVDLTTPAPLGFKAGDQVYELDGLGTIITINTVDGSGQPTAWTLTVAGGTLTTPPTNPVTFYGGSGSASVRFSLTWTRVSGLSLNPTGARIGFNGTAPVAKPTISGACAGNTAIKALLTALANYGLVVDSTSA